MCREAGLCSTTKSLPKRNGWSCPWHPQQVLAWCVMAAFAVEYFGVYVLYVPLCWRPMMITLPLVLFLALLVSLLVATTINPGDVTVWRKFQQLSQRPLPLFDRTLHKHVIEDYRCNLCQCAVGVRTKHCRLCNKCVSGFDHHCKWLNNCVGERNYRWFMAALVTALAASSGLSVLCFVYFVIFFAARDKVCYLDCGQISVCSPAYETGNWTNTTFFNVTTDGAIRLFSYPVPDAVFPTISVVSLCLALLSSFLLAQLLFFHVYLWCHGLSTYDYIMTRRQSQGAQETRRGTGRVSLCSQCKSGKSNTVRPSSEPESTKTRSEADGTASANSCASYSLAIGEEPGETVRLQTHAVLTLGNIQAVETEGVGERQSIDNTALHQPLSEEAHGSGRLEECRPTEEVLILVNQLGAPNTETDC